MQHLANETEISLKLGQHKLVEENLPALIAEARKVLNESKLNGTQS
jgi:two-component system sensor histidine kinase BarA